MQVEDSLVSVECEEALLVIIILLYCFASLPSVRLESDAKALARKLSPLELSLVAVDFVRDGWLNPVSVQGKVFLWNGLMASAAK